MVQKVWLGRQPFALAPNVFGAAAQPLGAPQGPVLTEGNEGNDGFELGQNRIFVSLLSFCFCRLPLSVPSATSAVLLTEENEER
jgi:hypothetical protein